ncbi:MAG TPA: prepilin-type N-terminal cleavage/methylation domain-containing protein [Candidatus Polarisedimenticolaceae bacterium]|nr:prepilin-type N-terminal cleavage/methylation domain-containing protein [Candidatus Polarisedimenticolaceae bacterium]
MPKKRDSSGFTLIELLIVVAIIGMLAAIAIPNLLNAIDQSKQKRTMAELRSVGTAVESYAVDQNFYPTANTAATLATLVTPFYVKKVPTEDGWAHTFLVESAGNDYTVASPGKDGVASGCVVGTVTTLFNQDVCFSNGRFIQWPLGVQQ